ncbi:hypothetical protein PVAND_010983 [Polypedilum vanderplanki]|uniref:ARID domain-containing protein n=1 Tax=Polypedilum vanderplanki TaxID=319348 RepID=A0A9J6CHQ4_POLVA|nr:hypothetical protein PVAND_010983 [Polypedilum vanderplanki]
MASQPSEHLQNDTGNQSLKGNEYQQQQQQQEILTKLQNGGQTNPSPQVPISAANEQQHGKGMKSPPSNGNGNSGHGGPNEMMPTGPGYHQDPNLGGMPPGPHPGQQHMQHHPEKDEMQQQQPPHHQQHPMYGHQPMHPMHAPQQHIPGHHLPMHPHQQRYPHHPHAPPMQHPMHPHDPNQQQQQMDPYAHYRGMMGPRPPQHYSMPGPMPNNTQNVPANAAGAPPQQGQTPTLNSLLQSQPSPQNSPQSAPPHRFGPGPNVYDPYGPPTNAAAQSGPPQPPPNSSSPMPQSQVAPPPPQQNQQNQQGWAPPPRPYSPHQYRGPPPPTGNSSRGQSPYPPPSSGVQSPGPYPGNQQQGNQPPGPPQQYQYPQRYPTPPGSQQQSMGPQNHRPPYSQWPSPAASPGPQPPPSQSPIAPPQSPGPQQQQPPMQHSGAPSPSSQQPQSPHQVNQKKKNSSAKKKTKKQQKQEAAAAAAQNNSNENSSNLAVTSQQPQAPPSQPPPSNNANASQQPGSQMRPISSPNSSSSGSRSMSPAVVGQQNLPMPPRPSSSHSQGMPQQQGNQSLNIPNSSNPQMEGGPQMPQNMPPQGYVGPPHQQYGPKIGPYPPQSQYSQGNYSPRYPGYQHHPPPPNSPGQYRPPMSQNHVNPAGHPQYPYHPQVWPPPPQNQANNPGAMSNHIQGKNIGPPPPQSPSQQQQGQSQNQQQNQPQQPGPVGSPRPLNYLKQHLQHKGGYSQGSPPPQTGSYGNGPGMHPTTMGPPSHHMGPPSGAMGPPAAGTPPSHMQEGSQMGMPNIHHPEGQDNGMPQGAHTATSLITTGPDGVGLDEASQQSTLSNTSIASGEDPQSTPKSRKTNEMMYPGHPSQANVSPSTSSGMPHNEEFEMGSPPWPRTPASPVFNSHAPPPVSAQDSFRTSKVTKSDSLAKLYEMDDNPERRGFLDKLLGYMDEIRKPVTACPQISKQPLDLYRLYIYVKERGGFMEVTKSKTWKDVAGLLGIGASSSAAYTLRKHYIKSILPFECQFDRGGIDPGPIIQSVEVGSKKKTPKATSVPSPGSSNSQDSFPAPPNSSLDAYYGTAPGQYPPPPTGQDYGQAMPRPPSQSNTQPGPGNAPQPTNDNISVSNPFEDSVASRPPYQQQQQQHTGAQYPRPPGPYQGQYQPPFGPVPDQQQPPYGPHNAGPGPNQYPPTQNQFPNNRQMYPYGAPPEDSNSAPQNDAYRGYSHYPPPPPQNIVPNSQQQGPRPPFGPQNQNQIQPTQQPSVSAPPQASVASSVPSATSVSQPPHASPSAAPPSSVNSNAPSNQNPSQTGPPPPNQPNFGPPNNQPDYYNRPENAPPRRHPDFAKDPNQQPYSPYGAQRPQMGYGGWPPNNSGQQFRQYAPQGPPNQWPNQGPPRPQGAPNQWDQQNRYPINQQYGPNQQWQQNVMRPPQRGGKPFPMPPPPQGPQQINKMPNQFGPHMHGHPMNQVHPMQGPMQPNQQPGGPQMKRDIVFPSDAVEATQPLLYRRKRMTKHDVSPVDPWRIFMSLRSGLLSESTWALDVLNVLLFDDSTVVYFGLTHLPGLLNLLLEHFQKSLADTFDSSSNNNNSISLSSVPALKDTTENENVDDENNKNDDECNKNTGGDNKLISSNLVSNSNSDTGDTRCIKKQIQMPANREEQDSSVDLGSVTENDLPNPNEHIVVLKSYNYTMQSRKGVAVKLQDSSNDIFIMDNQRVWDKVCNRDYFLKATVGDDPFSVGKEPSDIEYIMDCFKAEFAHIPFARYIKSSKSAETIEKARKVTENKPKRMRLSSEEEREVEELTRKLYKAPVKQATANNVVFKKETDADADCRQVDMEIEKVPNGPVNSDSASDAGSEKVKTESTEENTEKDEAKTEFDVKSTVRDFAKCLKRRRMSDYEDECYTRDEASLYLINDSQDALARRCICLSTILRNLTFVPGNELEFSRSTTFLSILGKLLLFHHEHPVRTKKQRNYDREEDADFSDSCSSLQGENEWWWDFLVQIRENMLVALTNISGHLDLSSFDEPISRPILDGLLHWAVCPSAHGQDPFTTLTNNSPISPQRLALEALCKLCVTDSNVDLVISTPPFSRLEKLCAVLTKHLCKNEDQVLREFSVNLLHYLASADSVMARIIARQSPCVSYLVAFIEQAEQTALGVANQHGINFLRENPDSMGTSLDMLRRAAGTLLHLAKHPDNRPLFMQQEQRLLGLVMSHILDQQVALIISRVLFQTSRGSGPLTTTQQNEQQNDEQPQKILPESQKSSANISQIASFEHSQKAPAIVHNSTINNPHIQPQNFPPFMKSPQPPFLSTPTKLLNSTDDGMKAKLNTINKQITANASNIPTAQSPSAPTPSIPQTVTASS